MTDKLNKYKYSLIPMKKIKNINSITLILSLNSLVSSNLIKISRKSTNKNNSRRITYLKDKKLNQNERAGILMGKKTEFPDQIQIKVFHIIEDLNPKNRSPYSVERITPHVYTQMEGVKKEHPYLDYIGEWHTHPRGPMQGSVLDHLSMLEMIDNPDFGSIFWAVLLIFIPNSPPIGYYYDKNNIISIPIKIQEKKE